MSGQRPTTPAPTSPVGEKPVSDAGLVGERPRSSRRDEAIRPDPAPAFGGVAPRPVAAWQACVAGLLHAACMIAAFPPFDLWGCSLLAVAPLAWLAAREVGGRAAGVGTGSSSNRSGPRREAPPEARRRSPLVIGLLAGIGSIPFHAFEHQWLWEVAGPGYPILVGLLALFPALCVWLLVRLRRRMAWLPVLVTAPVAWCGLEFFRGSIAFDGYPWFFVGHPLVAWWPAAAPARVIGALGVSLLAAGVGASIGWLLARRSAGRLGRVAIWLVALAACWAGLAFVPAADRLAAPPIIRVGVVQTNLPQSTKMAWAPADRINDLLWFLELTEAAARPDDRGRRPDLIVWPETMFPGTSLDAQARRAEADARIALSVEHPDGRRETIAAGALGDALLERQGRLGIPMLVGAIGYDNVRYTIREDGRAERSEDALYNSAFSLENAQVTGRYDKLHLTPFGEVMPYISHWPWLEARLLGIAAAGMRFDLSAGRAPRVLDFPLPAPPNAGSAQPGSAPASDPGEEPARFLAITPICFESTNPEVCRALFERAVEQGGGQAPIIMVNPTNDGWFGLSDAGRRQHLQLARWRAIELGIPVVRAANTGISCAIDPRGRLTAIGARHPDGVVAQARGDGVLLAELSLAGERTIFSQHGDRLGWWVLAATACLGLLAFWPIRTAGRTPPDPA